MSVFMVFKDIPRSAEHITVEEMAECSSNDGKRARRKGQVRLNSHNVPFLTTNMFYIEFFCLFVLFKRFYIYSFIYYLFQQDASIVKKKTFQENIHI